MASSGRLRRDGILGGGQRRVMSVGWKRKEAGRVILNLKMMAAAVLSVVAMGGVEMSAQSGPVMSPATAQAEKAQEPSAPTPQTVMPERRFPAVDPKNFTAASPTADEVNSFLKVLWGYDDNRIWQVQAVLKTQAPGVSKVVVYVGDKANPSRSQQTVFYVTPDGKHAIADQVIDFGAKPFAEDRKRLQERADGPAEGAASKELMLVEFTDLQCGRCKDAQDTMTNLKTDFPQARIVYEPIAIVPERAVAMKATAEGLCIRKAKGDPAFFSYVQAVFDKQAGLTAAAVDATLAGAAKAAGADPEAMAACAATPASRDAVKAEGVLATVMGIEQVPTLVVNGHALPMAGIPYETLKRMIAYQAGLDGMVVHIQPTLTTLK
jgi:protein-disulfide isomerase